MRTKEDAHDYRYFPDPDLPPLVIAPQWIEQVKATMPELPGVMAERFVRDDGLPPYDAAMMTQSLAFARYYEAARDACTQPKLVANWLMGEVSRRLNAGSIPIEACPIAPQELAELITLLNSGEMTRPQAKQLFDALWPESATAPLVGQQIHSGTGRVAALVEALGLKQMSDTGALEAIVDQVLAANPKSVDEYKAGKDKAFNALVGQVMKASQGKANPGQVNELLKKKLVR
jgi:aspartyl-tRNA(Asn)/glutamyl-tRNA(Gln) amidotransferase subunit B